MVVGLAQDARPEEDKMAYEGMIAETVRIRGANGDLIDAYSARPLGAGPFPGVIVIHHMPGWDEWSKEVTRRLAHHGYNAINPNLHFRAGPEGTLADVVARVREGGGSRDDFVIGDLEGALATLQDLPSANGRVGVIGFCSGGRISYMAAAKMPGIDAAVDCWGGNVVSPPAQTTDAQPQLVIEMTPDIGCPILGIFGNDDQNPAPEHVDQIEAELKKQGKEYEFHRYDGAGHGFFGWERSGYRPEQAVDAWTKVYAFYEKHLS
jgi:carboxymethylenebutenolidase